MDSNSRSKLTNMGKTPFKVVTVISGSTSAAVTYYYKPSFPCRLIEANLKVKTASAATAPSLAITKSILSDISAPKDKLITGYTEDSAVSSSALFSIATGTSNNVSVNAVPGANYQAAGEINTESKEALKLALGQCTTNALDATLILEFMPV